jgi:ankyrin repeat protein
MLATAAGSADLVDMLLKARASVAERDSGGRTCLHLCCGERAPLSPSLRPTRARHAGDGEGEIPVDEGRRRVEIARALVAAGASALTTDMSMRVPAHVAAARGQSELLSVLMEAARTEEQRCGPRRSCRGGH